jgi:hypothetical protein
MPNIHCIPSAKPANPGMTAFTPNRATSSRTTAISPGHTRIGFGEVIAGYSDRSAWSTSTRDARAAGINDATTAAQTSTAAATTIGTGPGRRTFST